MSHWLYQGAAQALLLAGDAPMPEEGEYSSPPSKLFNSSLALLLVLSSVWGVEDVVGGAPPPITEESEWKPVKPQQYIHQQKVSIDGDWAAPAAINIDEEYWALPSAKKSVTSITLIIGTGEVGVSAPAITDEEFWLPPVFKIVIHKQPFLSDDEKAPTAAVLNVDEESWFPKVYPRSNPGKAFPDTDEIVPIPAGITVEEESWSPVKFPFPQTSLLLIVGSQAKSEVIVSGTVIDDEACITVPLPPSLTYLIAPWEFGNSDNVNVTVPEDYWRNPTKPVLLKYDARFVIRDVGEWVPGGAIRDDEAFRPAPLVRQVFNSIPLLWALEQSETVRFASFDEEFWEAKRVVWSPLPLVTPWRAGENDLFVVSFGIDDEFWRSVIPEQDKLIGQRKWILDQNDIASVATPIVDEEYTLVLPKIVNKYIYVDPRVFEQNESLIFVLPPLPPSEICLDEPVGDGITFESPSAITLTPDAPSQISLTGESPTETQCDD